MSLVSSASNQAKAIHGVENQLMLNKVLDECYRNGYISDVQKNFRIGSEKNDKQFYAPFMIQFSNRTRWVIFATTSMRSDRIKGQQWDAMNLKNLDPSITMAVLTYPNDSVDKDKFKQQDERYVEKNEISSLDRIWDFNELRQAIQNEFYIGFKDEVQLSNEDENLKTSKQIANFLNHGKIWDIEGKNFETQIADILSNTKYLNAWKGDILPTEQNNYAFFCQMMSTFDISSTSVREIHATAKKENIGYLPSGGSPKTDVIAEVVFNNGNNRLITISCKRSKMSMVSVHQYTADTFADVLNENDVQLRKLLNDFQYYGCLKDLPDGVEDELTIALKPYIKKLVLWAIGGIGGAGNPETQWAQYIVSYQTEKGAFNVHSVEEYCDIICSRSLMFGTPFGWTFASKSKGKNIQLKAPVV